MEDKYLELLLIFRKNQKVGIKRIKRLEHQKVFIRYIMREYFKELFYNIDFSDQQRKIIEHKVASIIEEVKDEN